MDFASRFLGGYGQGRQDKQQADAQAKQEKINALLGGGYADPSQRDAALAAVAPLDFNAAAQAEQMFASRDERVNKGRANLSRLYLATPAQGRARVLQQFGQDFQRLGLDPADPNFEQVATGYAQAFGPSGSELPSEIRTLQMLQANPELLAVNDRFRGQKSFKEVTNPDGTVSYLALDSRTGAGGFAPIGGGGRSAPAPQGQPAAMSPDQIIAAIASSAREMVARGVPTEQIDGWVREQMRANAPKNVNVNDGPMVGQEATPLSQPAVRPPTLDQIPIGQYGGGPVGGAGLGESNADRARAAAAQAAQVEAAKIAAQQSAAPRQAELDAQREAAIAAAKAEAERASKGEIKEANAGNIVSLLAQAEPLIRQSTNGMIDNAATNVRAAFGQASPGGNAIASLKTIAGQLTAMQPRMEGPQSNIDVAMYREMAGDLANPNLPVAARLAALATIRKLQADYAPGGSKYTPPKGGQQQAGQNTRLVYNPATGELE